MLLSQVSQWVEEAKVILENGQKLASDADLKLSQTNSMANRLEQRVNYVATIFPSEKETHKQCILMVELVSKVMKSKIHGCKRDTLEVILGIHNVMPQLQGTRVPWFVNRSNFPGSAESAAGNTINSANTNITSNSTTLADYISSDAIDSLYHNVEIYNENYDKIVHLMDSKYAEIIGNVFTGSISKGHTQVLKKFHELHNVFESSDIRKILKESSVLEEHLAQLLDMLTNHYDQCVEAFNLVKLGVQNANFTILEGDVAELGSVQLELHQAYNILSSNDLRARELIQSLLREFGQLEIQLERQIESYKLFKDYNLSRFVTLVHVLEKYVAEENEIVDNEVAELEKLVHHYRQFITIYKKNYFKEFHYEQYTFPRLFLNRLTKFVNEELAELQAAEQERRRNWLEKYGNYIPKEFRLPGDIEYPTVVQIITEGLEGTEEDPEVERKVLDMISSN